MLGVPAASGVTSPRVGPVVETAAEVVSVEVQVASAVRSRVLLSE